MTNFIIPETIHVGYQNRSDTYHDKLGFVTYKDDLGNMKFEKSWEGWRDKTIEPDILNNEPIEGFVLNKNSGRQWGHFERAEFVRIFDPRGFEFEISIDNLMQIILFNGITKGNGVEGKLVYGWGYGKKKVSLLPITGEEYQKHLKLVELLNNDSAKLFEPKEKPVPGNMYKFKDGNIKTYLGKFDTYEWKWSSNPDKVVGHVFFDENSNSPYGSKYCLLQNFKKIVYNVGKNDNFDELLKAYLNTPFNEGTGFDNEILKLNWVDQYEKMKEFRFHTA